MVKLVDNQKNKVAMTNSRLNASTVNGKLQAEGKSKGNQAIATI